MMASGSGCTTSVDHRNYVQRTGTSNRPKPAFVGLPHPGTNTAVHNWALCIIAVMESYS